MIHIHIYNKNEKTSKSCMYWAKGFLCQIFCLSNGEALMMEATQEELGERVR